MRLIIIIILLSILLVGCGLLTESPLPPTITAVAVLPTLPMPPVTATDAGTQIPSPESTVESPNITSTAEEPVNTPTITATSTICISPAPGWTYPYLIQPGNILSQLAQRTGLSVAEIMAANCLESVNIFSGQILYFPPSVASLLPGSGATPNMTVETPVTFNATSTSTPSATPTIVTPDSSGPGDEDLKITPPVGPPGTSFTISLIAFPKNESVSLKIIRGLSTVIVNTTLTTDEMGNAIYVYESPEDAVSGTYLVNASAPNIVLSGEFRIDAIPEMDTPTPTSFPTVTITPSPSNTPLPTPSNTLVPTLAVTDTPIPTNTPEPSID